MENRVYYGEYSVRRWIELVLTKNIELPDYQRSFVWDQDKVSALIWTLREKRFVPPIILGACMKDNGVTRNYVIDGQQRLSSLILAYIKKFPKKGAFPIGFSLVSDDDVDVDDEECQDRGHDWTFRNIVKGVFEDPICLAARCKVDQYDDMDASLDGVDLDKTFIGFCYLVPGAKDENAKVRYFTRTFREVNIGGISLSPQESRRALYFLKNDKKDFFEPEWAAHYMLQIKGKTVQKQILDFVRYLSLVFDYHKHNDNETKVAYGRKKTMEKYYEEFVYSIVDGQESKVFCKFSEIFKDSAFVADMNHLSEEVARLSPPSEYDSIVDMDVHFMGLIYVVLVKKKSLRDDKLDWLRNEISALITRFRSDSAHRKGPGALKYLRMRLSNSIAVFKRAV